MYTNVVKSEWGGIFYPFLNGYMWSSVPKQKGSVIVKDAVTGCFVWLDDHKGLENYTILGELNYD